MENNRRRFTRIQFDTLAELSLQEGTLFAARVLDISLQGALVQITEPAASIKPGMACSLALDLSGEVESGNEEEFSGILMQMEVAHVNGQDIGLKCTEIDLDSITQLRRVVELNLGDESALFREFESLERSV
ncbi:MAG: PilZ domain-containing protein [Zoogloeaceae bacterium]|jgi:hypothetical protein|nr:PilZ domain-containing protein [Zoogloeaceae bacterium]